MEGWRCGGELELAAGTVAVGRGRERTTAENNNHSNNKNITFVPSLIHHLSRASPNLPFNGRTLLFIVYQLQEKQNPNNSAGNAHILYSLQYLTSLFRLATNAL